MCDYLKLAVIKIGQMNKKAKIKLAKIRGFTIYLLDQKNTFIRRNTTIVFKWTLSDIVRQETDRQLTVNYQKTEIELIGFY